MDPKVEDWSFVDDTFVDLEVRPSDPYSVELNYFVRDGNTIEPGDMPAFYRELARRDGVEPVEAPSAAGLRGAGFFFFFGGVG